MQNFDDSTLEELAAMICGDEPGMKRRAVCVPETPSRQVRPLAVVLVEHVLEAVAAADVEVGVLDRVRDWLGHGAGSAGPAGPGSRGTRRPG